jgi:hypothetical protein
MGEQYESRAELNPLMTPSLSPFTLHELKEDDGGRPLTFKKLKYRGFSARAKYSGFLCNLNNNKKRERCKGGLKEWGKEWGIDKKIDL